MRTKNRRQIRLVGEVPVEVAPTRTSWAVVCEVSEVLDGCGGRNGVDHNIISVEVPFCYFVLFTCVVVLKRLSSKR